MLCRNAPACRRWIVERASLAAQLPILRLDQCASPSGPGHPDHPILGPQSHQAIVCSQIRQYAGRAARSLLQGITCRSPPSGGSGGY